MKINLLKFRKLRGLSQVQLSKKSGIARSYISELESDKNNPTADILCKLAKALDCNINDLVDCDCEEQLEVIGC